jgi:hypothetical protein
MAAALVVSLALFPCSARGQDAMPRLTYTPPVELYHSALRPPEVYESTQINASIHVYHFRSAPPDIVERFHRTMLRDWIAPQHQEMQLARPPVFGLWSMAGADSVHYAQFSEAQPFGGGLRPRLRVLIVAKQAAAMLDAQAQSPQAWAIAYPSFQALLSTTRVETSGSRTRPDRRTPATERYAGLYVGVKPKFISAIGSGIGAGSGGFVQARHMYLFSDDGRVYRAYDDITAPGGDIRRFDFEEASRADPVNSGVYGITANQLTIRMGERLDEVIVAPEQPGRVTIGTVTYFRQ